MVGGTIPTHHTGLRHHPHCHKHVEAPSRTITHGGGTNSPLSNTCGGTIPTITHIGWRHHPHCHTCEGILRTVTHGEGPSPLSHMWRHVLTIRSPHGEGTIPTITHGGGTILTVTHGGGNHPHYHTWWRHYPHFTHGGGNHLPTVTPGGCNHHHCHTWWRQPPTVTMVGGQPSPYPHVRHHPHCHTWWRKHIPTVHPCGGTINTVTHVDAPSPLSTHVGGTISHCPHVEGIIRTVTHVKAKPSPQHTWWRRRRSCSLRSCLLLLFMQPHLCCTALTMITGAEVIPLLLTLLSPGGQAVDRRVAGLLHHSVELYHPDLPHPVLDVIWNFQNQTKITKVFMYNSGHETTYSPQFADRLEASNNGTKLRIKDLRMEDTGAYTSIITFVDNDVFQVTYHLTVYEPVPPLDIQTEVTGYRKDGCNVTLQCSVPSHPLHLSYTWKYRHQDQEYQPYDSGSTTQISLAPDHQDMEILCIVHNPADHKNVSISVKSCFSTGR
ncbi:hypothetical protein GDO81_027053 [Engystomops pustulosus]|uniref:Ig-like domain-containing protein n=1 Tax=Engystomops pustulosus TaxID=76066 RepID=A0AAV6ZEN9_ENGPU|nr:hypothetical protein GDO81_027053 [Engystomops pustulosus]